MCTIKPLNFCDRLMSSCFMSVMPAVANRKADLHQTIREKVQKGGGVPIEGFISTEKMPKRWGGANQTRYSARNSQKTALEQNTSVFVGQRAVGGVA